MPVDMSQDFLPRNKLIFLFSFVSSHNNHIQRLSSRSFWNNFIFTYNYHAYWNIFFFYSEKLIKNVILFSVAKNFSFYIPFFKPQPTSSQSCFMKEQKQILDKSAAI